MGYYAEQLSASFHIKAEHKPFALASLRVINANKELFLDNESVTSLEQALDLCGYDVAVADGAFDWIGPSTGDKGDITHIEFKGQKYRDDEFVFAALASYVEPGSYIEFRGEDGSMWRFTFEDGELFTQDGVITWLEPVEFEL